MSPTGPSGGFSLFPHTNSTRPPSRRNASQPRAAASQTSPIERDDSTITTASDVPEDSSHFVVDGTPFEMNTPSRRRRQQGQAEVPEEPSVSRVVLPSDVPARTDTAFSGASTLVRSNSNRSRSSIAKRPLDEAYTPSPGAEAGLRSIFPRYDPTRPLDRQDYYPTQTSPSHIPRTVISRQSHVPQSPEQRSPPVRSPVKSPMSASSGVRWPRRHQEPPVVPPVSTSEALRDYWKAANGWKASTMEGRTYCMKLTPEKDAPVYHLSSTSQTLYHMRINPTSVSAYITLSRHDPAKPYKERDPSSDAPVPGGILAAMREADKNKTWHEAINTTLEEDSRRLPPNDGLVALLYPCAATRMALDKPGDIQAVMTAERECARLVWDEDSQNYFLVHPALATPFCITVEKYPAWSQTEYTLEHIESPQHLAKLSRDGTGEGWLELDTLVAGRIESFYILDVAVCALLIVAHLHEKDNNVEQFEPPPLQPPPAHLASHRSSLMSKMGIKKDDKRQTKKRGRLEEFEMDLESQTSSLGKHLDVKDKDKLPGTTRTIIKLLRIAFKCFIWAATLTFKALMAIVVGLSKCVTSEKL
jgi:hypothetical protein